MPVRRPADVPKPPKHLKPTTRRWFANVCEHYELEQHHVRLRVARTQDGHQVAARALLAVLEVVRELVQLADRPLQVLLLDLVLGRGHSDGPF